MTSYIFSLSNSLNKGYIQDTRLKVCDNFWYKTIVFGFASLNDMKYEITFRELLTKWTGCHRFKYVPYFDHSEGENNFNHKERIYTWPSKIYLCL